jgi:hypothetical protein
VDTRRFKEAMAGAIFVRVAAEPTATQARTFEIWIVATDDPAEAERAVREMVPAGRDVEAIHDRPSEETIKRLALPPGKAWLL